MIDVDFDYVVYVKMMMKIENENVSENENGNESVNEIGNECENVILNESESENEIMID